MLWTVHSHWVVRCQLTQQHMKFSLKNSRVVIWTWGSWVRKQVCYPLCYTVPYNTPFLNIKLLFSQTDSFTLSIFVRTLLRFDLPTPRFLWEPASWRHRKFVPIHSCSNRWWQDLQLKFISKFDYSDGETYNNIFAYFLVIPKVQV